VIRDCWNWFLVPVGVKAISAAWAFGINLVWRSLADAPSGKQELTVRWYSVSVIRLLLLWAMAWGAHNYLTL